MVALIIIYNHKYDKNIPILENIYKDKFKNIFHLVPFYTGEKDNVISVYENSFYFQGYIAQAYQILKTKGNFDHYLFIGDDLLLNPEINDISYKDIFKISEKDSFFPRFDELRNQKKWVHLNKIVNYTVIQEGLEISTEFPSKNEVLSKFCKNNLSEPYINTADLYSYPRRQEYPKGIKGFIDYKKAIYKTKKILRTKTIEISYPLVSGYSDIIIIPQKEMKQFVHYCGLFAASKLFVEVAIPSAIVMACENIQNEKKLDKKGLILWDKDRENLEQEYNSSLQKLLSNFQDDILYIHPVKLSQWTN
jgi:hypothetical protein